MRTFIGEQPDTGSQDGWESMRSVGANPNENDVPEPLVPDRQLGTTDSVTNVWWSERANNEARLQQMRPADLPRQASGSEAGYSASVFREAREEGEHEELHPPYETLFTEAAVEMQRQTSLAAYPREEAMRFLSEQASFGASDRSNLDSAAGQTATGRPTEIPGRDIRPAVELTSGTINQVEGQAGLQGRGLAQTTWSGQANLQELPLEQLYEALDQASGNPLLLEMMRRIEVAERASSRRTSEITAMEFGSDLASVQNIARNVQDRTANPQSRLAIGSTPSIPRRTVGPGQEALLPPLPVPGVHGQVIPRERGVMGVSNVAHRSIRGVEGQSSHFDLYQANPSPSQSWQSQGLHQRGGLGMPTGFSAPLGLPEFRGSAMGSEPVGLGGTSDPDPLRFSPLVSPNQPANPKGFRSSPGCFEGPTPQSEWRREQPKRGITNVPGEQFVSFRPKALPMNDLIDLDFPVQTVGPPNPNVPLTPGAWSMDPQPTSMSMPHMQVAPIMSQSSVVPQTALHSQPVAVDLLGLDTPSVNQGTSVGDILSGKATSPFQEMDQSTGYNTPRNRPSTSRPVFTPGGTRVPEYPSDHVSTPKHSTSSYGCWTPGRTRVPEREL